MMGRRIAIFAVLILTTTHASAFDGHRKGFVLGGGIGVSPITHYETSGDDVENSTESISFGLSAGYGMTENDLLVMDFNIAPHGLTDIPGVTISQNFLGLCWYRYLSSSVNSPFIMAGVGSVSLATMDTRFRRMSDPPSQTHFLFGGSGIGAKFGVGLQCSRNLQLAAEYWLGSFERRDSKQVRQYVVNCRVSLLLI